MEATAKTSFIQIRAYWELKMKPTRLDFFLKRFNRRMDMLRGKLAFLSGIKAGKNFALGNHVNFVYPSFFLVGNNVNVGGNSYYHCLAEKGVKIGNHSTIEQNAWLHCGGREGDYAHGFFIMGEDSFIGCYSILGAGGGITIGNHVRIGQNVNIHAENHVFEDRERLIRDQGVVYGGVTIEDDVWVGSKTTILDGVTIGKGAVIGAGTVVTRSIPPYAIAVGVPARVIGQRGQSS